MSGEDSRSESTRRNDATTSSREDELFDGAVEAVDDDADDSAFEPLSINDDDIDYDHSMWDDEHPLQWMFKKDGRLELVLYALNEVRSGDPIYQNKSGVAEAAGVSRHTCHRHLEDLVKLDIYEARREKISRYRPNSESQILKALETLDRAVGNKYEITEL